MRIDPYDQSRRVVISDVAARIDRAIGEATGEHGDISYGELFRAELDEARSARRAGDGAP